MQSNARRCSPEVTANRHRAGHQVRISDIPVCAHLRQSVKTSFEQRRLLRRRCAGGDAREGPAGRESAHERNPPQMHVRMSACSYTGGGQGSAGGDAGEERSRQGCRVFQQPAEADVPKVRAFCCPPACSLFLSKALIPSSIAGSACINAVLAVLLLLSAADSRGAGAVANRQFHLSCSSCCGARRTSCFRLRAGPVTPVWIPRPRAETSMIVVWLP